MNKQLSALALALILTLSANVTFAEEAMQEEAMAEEMTGEEMPMAPKMQEMMKNFEAYQAVNENHDVLKKLEGDWTAEITHWMAPDAPAETMTGSGTAEMTMGGRFLEQNFTSEWQGKPFTGRGIYGYDNIQEMYTAIWYDNMGTGIMISYGDYDDEENILSEEGSLSCPMTNDSRWYRAEMKFIDENNYTYETYMEDENGEEFRSMLIKYTRA